MNRTELEDIRKIGYVWNDPWDVVELFEQKVAEFAGSKYAVAVDSATDGLFLCLKGLLSPTFKLEIPANTYCSVPMTIRHAGWDFSLIDKEWSGIYQLGTTPIYDSAARFTKGMWVNGDALQVLSFHIKKILPIGKGGMILTDNESAASWLRLARYEGRDIRSKYEDDKIQMFGWNMYMTPEDAARGLLLFNDLSEQNDDIGGSHTYPDLRKLEIFK